MSLLTAHLISGLVLLALGVPLLIGSKTAAASLKAMPRSPVATAVFFGAASIWFLYLIWHLSPADFGEYRTPLFIGFALIAVLSVKYAADFLAVRGLCGLMILAAVPLLGSAYMKFDQPQRLLMVTLVYIGIALALWFAVQPYRVRDFFEWLFRAGRRSRTLGAVLAGCGLALLAIGFTF